MRVRTGIALPRAALPRAVAVALTAVAVLATVAALAACGTATVPPGDVPDPLATAYLGPAPGSRAEAAALGRQMLSSLRLPAGARRLPQAPLPSSLSQPAAGPAGGATSLDEYQLFALPQPMPAAAAALTADVPAGMRQTSTGQGSGPSGPTMMEVGDTPRSLPAGIYTAQFVLTVVPAASGGSLLRADAELTWFPPRTDAEYIFPASYHALTIAVTILNPRLHTLHKVVTSQAVINRLAEALNQAQAAPLVAMHCPAAFASYRLTFASPRPGLPAVVVSTTRWPCGGAGITVGGRTQPPLLAANTVVAIADQALGVIPGP